MNHLKDAGTIVEASLMQAYQELSNNDTDYTIQVTAMYPAALLVDGVIDRKYMVVIEVGSVYDYRVAVCYNGILIYVVENPNSKYYEDLKNNNLCFDTNLASELYND